MQCGGSIRSDHGAVSRLSVTGARAPVISEHGDRRHVRTTIRARAGGYLIKGDDTTNLSDPSRAIHSGHLALTTELMSLINDDPPELPPRNFRRCTDAGLAAPWPPAGWASPCLPRSSTSTGCAPSGPRWTSQWTTCAVSAPISRPKRERPVNLVQRLLLGTGQLPADLRADLAAEQPAIIAEGPTGSITLRHYRAPGRRAAFEKRAAAGAVAVTRRLSGMTRRWSGTTRTTNPCTSRWRRVYQARQFQQRHGCDAAAAPVHTSVFAWTIIRWSARLCQVP